MWIICILLELLRVEATVEGTEKMSLLAMKGEGTRRLGRLVYTLEVEPDIAATTRCQVAFENC